MYVDALAEGSRTRVRFPPPPPFSKREALDIQGLFVFDLFKFSLSKRFPMKLCRRTGLEEILPLG